MPEDRASALHDEYRRKIWDDIKSGSENFDKYLLTFSAGALGLSLSFFKDVVPLERATHIPALIWSWVFFVACILITLISFQISIKSQGVMFFCANEYYLEGKKDAFDKHLRSWSAKAVTTCAWAGIGFFVAGLVCTMIFVAVNVAR
jgi:hypothetical protein